MTQRALLTVAILLSAASVHAGGREDVFSALAKCADLADGPGRLDCYDRLAPQVRAMARPQTPRPAAANGGGAADATAGVASSDHSEYQPIGGEILPLTIGVASYEYDAKGYFTVTLDNDQVWRSHDPEPERPRFSKKHQNIVMMTRGTMGGYDLHIKGTSRFFKVVRVK